MNSLIPHKIIRKNYKLRFFYYFCIFLRGDTFIIWLESPKWLYLLKPVFNGRCNQLFVTRKKEGRKKGSDSIICCLFKLPKQIQTSHWQDDPLAQYSRTSISSPCCCIWSSPPIKSCYLPSKTLLSFMSIFVFMETIDFQDRLWNNFFWKGFNFSPLQNYFSWLNRFISLLISFRESNVLNKQFGVI